MSLGQETEGTYLKHYDETQSTNYDTNRSMNRNLNRNMNHDTDKLTSLAFAHQPNKPDHRQKRSLTRRQFLKGSALAGAVIGAGGLGYTWIGEPNWLEKVRISLELPNLPASLNGMRLVQFSDMHLGMGKNANDLEQLVDAIISEQPDMICFTGDMVDEHPADLMPGVGALQRLQAPLGKYAILGNHDYLDDVVAVTNLLKQGGFDVLINEHRLLRRTDGVLALAGLDDQLLGNPDVQKAARGMPDDACRILLMHEPDYADRVPEELKFRLQLSGHSHGGQIRLPLLGAVITPKGSRKYIMGGYRAGKGGHLPLYVNRGIGMSQLPVRFMCRPELTIFTLYRA
ncbi:metallophosphoesterase [Paenibacillus campi]|uniref:metallophosphoesterase n=1 Tax=Paenibacillus campi TaxID=3106031 RepID=UPI002AFFEB37|nr:metallophosphoesterase [Paenibacillus sp. SGZ-1014]